MDSSLTSSHSKAEGSQHDSDGKRARQPAIISLRDASFSYDGNEMALSHITLDVRQGEHLCILGSNGSGKSTLARLLNGLLVPDEGDVFVCGINTNDVSRASEIRASCGMVFQSPQDQMVADTVGEDTAFGPQNLELPKEEVEARVATCLAEVGLSGFEMRETNSLSGGQQQRVAIAGALAMNPKAIVFDEASSMLDPRGRKGLEKLRAKLLEAGMTVISITHMMSEAAEADRIIVLSKGKIALEGTPREIFQSEGKLATLSLALPFAMRLHGLLEARGVDIKAQVSDEAMIREIKALLPQKMLDEDQRHCEELSAERRSRLADGARTCARATSSSDADSAPESNSAHPEACSTNASAAASVGANASVGLRGVAANPRGRLEEAAITFDHVRFSYASKRQLRRLERVGSKEPQGEKPRNSWGAHPHAIWALDDVSFQIERQQIVGIIGHTGSGKSTMIRLMNGLLKPNSGSVCLEGRPLSGRKSEAEALRQVGLVFQHPERQLFAKTVFDDVAFGPRNLGLSEDAVRERTFEMLRLVKLDPQAFAGKSPFLLSGGQKRLAAIAGVLAMGPSILVLDEPTAGLDPKMRQFILGLIGRLRDEGSMTIVMASHDMDEVAHMCDKVIAMDKGRILSQGSPASVLTDERALKEAGLAEPHVAKYSRKLHLPIAQCTKHSGKVPTMQELADDIADAILEVA